MTFEIPYLLETPMGENEIKNVIKLGKSLVAEMIGVMFLVLVGCGSCYKANDDYVRIALAFGVTVATMAQSIGHISGCHINPAITAGLFVGAKIGLVKGLLYIVFQCIGGLIGGGLLSAFTIGNLPMLKDESGNSTNVTSPVPGQTKLGDGVTVGQGVGIELFITFVLVLVVFAAAADENNAPGVKGSAPLAIGLSITTCHLFAIPLTGSSMNPARSLGIAPFTGWENHFVYWIGPILGGVFAALTYVLLFKADPPSHSQVATKENQIA